MTSNRTTPSSTNPFAHSTGLEAESHGLLSRLKMGRLGKNILSNAGGNALHSAMQLGLLLVLIRILDDTRYAAFLLSTFLVGLLEMASDYGARIWGTREFSVSKKPVSVLRRSVQCKIVYTLLSGCIAAMMPLNTLPGTAFVLCVLVACTQPSTDPLLWFLRGQERLDVEAGVVLVFRTAIVIAMLIVAFVSPNLNLLLVVWLAGNTARLLVESRLPVTQRLFQTEQVPNNLSASSMVETVKYVFPIGTAFVLTALFQRATIFLLDIFATAEDIKFYGTAFKVVSTSGFIATSVFVSSFPRLTKAIAAGETVGIHKVVRRMLMLVTLIFVPVCIAGITVPLRLSDWFRSSDLTDIAGVTVLLMPGLYLSCINMGLKYTLNAFELNWQDVAAVVAGMIVLGATTVFHGSLTWCEAAALGWGTGEATLLTCRLMLLRKHGRHGGVPVGTIFGSAIGLLLLIVFCYPAVPTSTTVERVGRSAAAEQLQVAESVRTSTTN